MGDILRIYSGGNTQINLYDSTNGELYLGYIGEDIKIVSEPITVPLSTGGRVETKQIVSFEATLLETDSTQITNLIARKGFLQEVYIIGIDSAYKMRDCFLSINSIRSMKEGEAHVVKISGQRQQESVAAAASFPETKYCQFVQNFLGGFGAMLGAGTEATGWTNSGATSLSLDTSHLGGGYENEWRFTLSDAGDRVYIRVRFPVDQLLLKLTASAYIDNRKAGISYYTFGIATKDSDGVIVDEDHDVKTLAEGINERVTKTHSFTPSADCHYLDIEIIGHAGGTAELGVDNVQLEVGSLTDYVENA